MEMLEKLEVRPFFLSFISEAQGVSLRQPSLSFAGGVGGAHALYERCFPDTSIVSNQDEALT
eukprot:2318734-Pyramimonas_sp.AAC.1